MTGIEREKNGGGFQIQIQIRVELYEGLLGWEVGPFVNKVWIQPLSLAGGTPRFLGTRI